MTILSPITDVIEAARNGRMFILVDDEDRENEGDIIIPAQMATPSVINFMAKNGRGLICLALTSGRIKKLRLPMMSQRNESRHQTAFTVSIEARDGITTGISTADRAHTISVAIDESKQAVDLVSPGHIFPLMAQDGGVLIRAGHTEASVDICRLAGLNPSAVICEIMKDDGTMARFDDLVSFARHHGLIMGSIADLIAYRRRQEKLIEEVSRTDLHSRYGGEFQLVIYKNRIDDSEHIVLIKGDISTGEPINVRMHALNVFGDVVGDMEHPGRDILQQSMLRVGELGRGVIVVIRDPRVDILSNWVDEHARQDGQKSIGQIRDYGLGAQILVDLGIRKVVLLTNSTHSLAGFDGFGIHIVGQETLSPERL